MTTTGRGARGRKQYRYHADWLAQREQLKFDRMRGSATARIAQRCQDLPGQRLFQYIDEDGATAAGAFEPRQRPPAPGHSGHDFTVKDFRTWHASVMVWELAAGPLIRQRNSGTAP